MDIPLAAAHFFYHAGWADKLEYAGFGRPDPRPLGVAGQVIPWNFPLLMAGLEDRPGAGLRQHRGAQAGRDDAADRAGVRRDLPAGRPAAGRGQHRAPARARPARALVEHPGIDKVAFTGSTEVGQADPAHAGRHRQAADPGARRQGREHRLRRRARSTRRSRASSTASSSTRATSAAPAPGCWCRSRCTTRCSTRCSGGSARCGWATRWTRTPTSARSTPPRSWPRSASCPTSARPRARERWSPPCALPDRGFWFPPTVFTGVAQSHRIAREEVFGPVLSVLTFRTPAEAVEKANNTPYGLSAGVWTEKGSRILWMARPAAGRRGLGQHVQQVRPDLAVRRLQGVRVRARGRPARAGGVPRWRHRERRARIGVRKTYKLYIGGAFPRSESGRSYEVSDRGRAVPGQRGAGLPQGRPGRGGRPRARRSAGLVGGHRVQPGPGALPGRRDAGGPAGPVRRRGRATAGSADPEAEAWWTRPSTAGSGTPAGRTSSTQVRGAANPVAGPYFNFSLPEPTGVVAVSRAAGSSRCSGSSRSSRR